MSTTPMPREQAEALLRDYEAARAAGLTPAAVADLTTKLQKAQEDLAAARMVERAPDGHDLRRHLAPSGALALVRTVENVRFAGVEVAQETPGLLDATPADEWQADFQRKVQARHYARFFLASQKRGSSTPRLDADLLAHASRAPREIRSQLEAHIQKAFSDTSGSGAEWIPDTPLTAIYEDFYLPSVVESIFGVVPMERPLLIPKISDVSRPYIAGIANTDSPANLTPTTVSTSSQTIDAQTLAVRMILDAAATEDSIIPLVPELQRRLVRAIADGVEDAIINGDTGTHQDTALSSWNIRSRWGTTGLGGSADHRRLWIGLRALAFDRSDCTVDQSSGQTVAKIMEQLAGALGERGSVGTVIITSPEVFFKKILTDTNLLTVYKAGMMATIVNGGVAQIGGMRIVLSRFLSADLQTSGLFTAAGGTKSGVLAVCPDDFKIYSRRGPMLELDKEIEKQVHNLVATRRLNFATLSASSVKCVAFGYNWL